MLNRMDLYAYFGSSDMLLSEPAVKIHGAMMKAIPTQYASKLHLNGYHPYSVYVIPYGSGFIIRISTLNDEAAEIIQCMGKLEKITLFGTDEPMLITDRKPHDPIKKEALTNELSGQKCRIEFVTPAMIKTGGKPSAFPDIPSYFLSVIRKYNTFEGEELSHDSFVEAWKNASLDEYELKSVKYNVSGHIFPGMVGYCDITFPKNKSQADLLKRVIAYSTYSGVGGKTGMGMGGIVIHQ